MKVKPISEITAKFLDVTPGRQSYYEKAASVAGADWEKATTDAAKAYKSAVTAANIEAMFTGGVKRAGAAKYERKVKAVGPTRFSEGVRASGEDFEKGFAPYADELARIVKPVRQPRGSEANYDIVRKIGSELHKKRLALRAAGA